MPRRRLQKEDLLQDAKVKRILDCFLVFGIRKGLKFSELQRYTGIRSVSSLHDKLEQLKREGILIQKGKKQPYYLATKFYNEITSHLLLDKFKNIHPNFIFALDEYKIFYGIYPEALTEKDKESLYRCLHKLTNILRKIKTKHIKSSIKAFYENVFKHTNIDKNKYPLTIVDIIFLSNQIYFRFGKNVSLSQIKNFLSEKHESEGYEDKKFFDTISFLIYKLIREYNIFPPEVGIISYHPFSLMVSKDINLNTIKLSSKERIGFMLPYGKFPISPEIQKIVDFSIFSTDSRFDYVLYVKTKREYALVDNCSFGKKDPNLKYWQNENKKIDNILTKKEKNYYNRAVAEWIKYRFLDELIFYDLFGKKRLECWIMRYRSFGYSFTLKDIKRYMANLGIEIDNKMMNLLKDLGIR